MSIEQSIGLPQREAFFHLIQDRLERPLPQFVRFQAWAPISGAWSYLNTELANDPWTMAWSSADESQNFLAIGAQKASNFVGPSRFSDAEAFCSQTREQIGDLYGEEGHYNPMFVGGFAFSDAAPGGPWSSWPAGLLWVPRLLLVDRPQGTEVIGCVAIDPALTPQKNWERVLSALGEIYQSQPCNVARPLDPERIDTNSPHEEKAHFLRTANQAITQIEDGPWDKVVLSRVHRFEARTGTAFDAVATLKKLRRDQPDCTTFLVRGSTESAFLGATPEPLIRTTGNLVRTCALAGSQPRGTDTARDTEFARSLRESVKEQHEHELVLATIKENLAPFTAAISHSEQPTVHQLRDVQHLQTVLSAQLHQPTHICHLIDALHPTPAIAGLPRDEVLPWLAEHEANDRGWYAGTVGWLDGSGNGHFVVSIRSALVGEEQVTAYAGSGLVSGSQAESEWQETTTKLQSIATALVIGPTTQPPQVQP